MKALKTKGLLVFAASAIMALAGCTAPGASSSEKSVEETYARENDDTVYDRVFGAYDAALEEAHGVVDNDERYVAYAKAEAKLLAAGIMVPTYTQGGTYAVTRVAPKTISAAQHGLDSDRLQYMRIRSGAGKETLITAADRAAMKAQWSAAAIAGDSSLYDVDAFFAAKGWEFATEYITTTSKWPATADVLSTYRAADTEPLCNGLEGLVEYDNVGKLVGAMAVNQPNGLPYILSEDGKTLTFEIREGAKWVNSIGEVVADVTADDFEAGFQHGLDACPALSYLSAGIIEGVTEYLGDKTKAAGLGIKAVDGKVVIKLVQPESFFDSRLVYSCFMPLNRAFYVSKGGKFGADFNPKDESYLYGKQGEPDSILYNSAFYCSKWETTSSSGEMVFTKNQHFYNAENVKLNTVKFIFDNGGDPEGLYNQTLTEGKFAGIGLGAANGLLDKAKKDGIFNDYAYISDTNATTFFGSLNLNRGAFAAADGSMASSQSEHQKVLNHNAFNNLYFRRGFLHGFDRVTWNDVRCGEGVGRFGLRNTYTPPNFVRLGKTVMDGEHSFPAGSSYGDLIMYYVAQEGCLMKSADDGVDGWFDVKTAKAELAAAKAEIENWGENDKIVIDKIYYAPSVSMTAQANAFKQVIEKNIGEYVTVNLIAAETEDQYYAAGYDLETGSELPQDFFDGSGWGPDYLDPGTYLDTYSASRSSEMIKVSGLDM